MKLRVGLGQDQGNALLLQIVADGMATAQDVAVAIASAGQDQLANPPGAPLTLEVTSETARVGRSLAPDTPMAESGVVSGSRLSVVEHRPGADSRTGAVLRVVAGPDKGIEVPLRVGTSTVGRGPDCAVRLSDPRVSKRHAKILVRSQIEIVDENSANGVLLAGQRVTRIVLKPGDTVVLGDTAVQVEPTSGSGAGDAATEVRYLRPPVVQSRPRSDEIELPEVPSHPRRTSFPWLSLLAPLIMGGLLYMFTRSTLALAFVAMSPLLMLGSYVGSVVDGRRRAKLDLANFEEAMKDAETDIVDSRTFELRQLHHLFPSVSSCVSAALNRQAPLWVRRPEHPEFLQVRLGTGALAAKTTVKAPRRQGIAHLVQRQRDLIDRYRLLPDAPVIADLRSVGGVGFAGRDRHMIGVARGAIAQTVIMHSPAEVVVACLASNATKEQWSWLEWLPHCWSPHSPVGAPLLASDDGRGRALVDQLDELIDLRSESARPTLRGPLGDQDRPSTPVTPAVLLVVHDAPVSTERLASIAERGPDVGVYVLWLADDRAGLPAACRTYVDISGGTGATVGMVRSEQVIKNVSTESMDLETAFITARSLAPVVDASAPVDDDSDLPRMVSMIGLLGGEEAADPQLVMGRWQENGSLTDRTGRAAPRMRAGDLRAVVGHAGLEPFAIDLRTQGPHGLVGGTTGAGKSEFLQAWVLGLAHTYSPDHVTFLFVDYKGGSAFARCEELPHCVGMVTDLSPYLVRRALRSLGAEIRRREHLFRDKGVKDLLDFEKTGDPDCPPSLIIVVDEFAALVGEVPEFVDGVIDVAQRGRSLGLHLILATQRPTGVIKESLRANTNLRIALRMNDAHDSSDVLGSAVAAEIDPATPGRGVARTGPGRLTSFQSAFPGARTPPVPPTPPIDVLELDFGASTPWKIPRPKTVDTAIDKDIDRMVDAITEASRLGNVPIPRRPWLKPLGPGYNLHKLNPRADHHIVLGFVDDPDKQSQDVAYFEPDESGNIVYYGASGSGKTTALRSLAIAASITPRSGPVHIYGLDFGGGGLSMLAELGNVGSIIAGEDDERISRLMALLSATFDERSARYKAVGADTLSAYRTQPGKANEPRLLVLIDGFGTFRAEYDSGLQRQAVYAQLQRLVNEGRSVGIHFAVSADRAAAIPSSMLGAFQHRIVMRMADADAYLSLGVPKDVLNSSSPPGRCMNADRPNELQLAVLGDDPSPVGQAREIKLLAELVAAGLGTRPVPVRRLPATVQVVELPSTVDGWPTLGIEDRTLAPVGFEPQGVHIVAGPPKSGVSSSLRWLAESMRIGLPQVPRILLSARKTELAGLPVWTATCSGIDQVKDYLGQKLSPYLLSESADGRPSVAVFIDQFPEFANSSLDAALTEALKNVRRHGHLLFGAGETGGFSGFSSLLGEMKAARAGLLLQPEGSDGDLVKVQLPRGRAADFPPGRGYWVRNGVVRKVQLPVVD